MKTLNSKTILAAATLLLTVTFAKAQTPVHCCTVIEVTDGYYSDKVWMITEPGTSDGFDNGYDGYKFLNATTPAPQVFDKSIDGTFQVSSFPTIENNAFAFIAGEGTQYTFTFTHYDINYFYPGLYLVDLLKGDTIDVYAQGAKHTFTASKSDMQERFKFITKLPVVVPPVVVPPVVEPPVVVVPPVVVPPVVPEPEIVDPGIDPNDGSGSTVVDKKDKKDKKENKAKKVKVRAHNKKLIVENPNKQKANIKIVNARNGKVVKQVVVKPETNTTIETGTQSGQYVIQTTVEVDVSSTTVLMQ
jgi:hypothetical protein